ncbi:FG-GAP repeat protein, partial [bacterium]|nr:FG-GAP repeat protein [bacterium]
MIKQRMCFILFFVFSFTGIHHALEAADMDLLLKLDHLPASGRNGSMLGEEVTDIGDVNGDGYADWAIGLKDAADYATGRSMGKVYIYFGANTLINEKAPDLILTGEADGDSFGCSVASAGDVNGDNYADVIVGAPGNDSGGTDAGRAYIYYGGPTMDNVADIILTGESVDDYFGYSVSGAGDVNGDNYADVIIGAYRDNTGGYNAGQAYIYYGGLSMNNVADIMLTNAAAYDYFGYSVASAGDVNGDTYTDVMVGAPGNDSGGTDAGQAYIYYGGPTMDNAADIILTGAAVGEHFGYSVSSAGDVNGDTYADVMVGAYKNDAAGTSAGRAYIYYGGPGMDNTADVILTGAAADDSFGSSVASAGDVNGDTYADVIVGANDAGGTDAGRAYIYYGGPTMDNVADIILTGAASDDYFGYSVSSAGDVNGDNYADVIVGAYYNDAGGSNAGQAYIYYGGPTMDNTADIILTGAAVADHFGYSVSSAGDVNGDTYADVMVGAYRNNAGGIDDGRTYIYYGGPGMDNAADITLTGAAAWDYFGYSVSGAGDVNGDTYADVMVGAYGNDAGGIDAGRAYIYYGGPGMDNTADIILTGESAADYFGYSVSGAGDVNGDTYADVMVGAYKNDAAGTSAGRAYIYYGGPGMDNAADIILTGAAVGDHFGYSVS